MNKRHLTVSALLASALVLTACGNSDDTATTGTGANAPSGGSASTGREQANDVDIAFLTGMTPHHEQAVEMSGIVLAADPPADVAAIAEQIKAAQGPEIEQMEAMLADLGVKTDGMAHGGGHSGGMSTGGHGGMMTDEMMAALDAATGTEAARLYLEGMIAHHQGAIEASDTEIADGQYGPAVALAREIKEAQAAEITEMQALLKTL